MLHQEVTIPLHLVGTITTGDGKWPWEAPYAGRVIQLKGTIKTIGSGAGTSTDFQLRNVTQAKDILATVGAFEVDSAINRLEGQVVNFTNCSFAAGDTKGTPTVLQATLRRLLRAFLPATKRQRLREDRPVYPQPVLDQVMGWL